MVAFLILALYRFPSQGGEPGIVQIFGRNLSLSRTWRRPQVQIGIYPSQDGAQSCPVRVVNRINGETLNRFAPDQRASGGPASATAPDRPASYPVLR
ncbi:hypothetical protein GCM10027456_36200 [Kineosporia babensis]